MYAYSHPSVHHRIIKQSQTIRSFPCKILEPRGKYKTREESNLAKAMEAKQSGKSFRRAAEMYGVPKSTLCDHMSGRVEVGARAGPKPYLTVDEEEELESFLIQTARIGYPHTRMTLVQQIVDAKGLKVIVSNGWWEWFIQRHPDLSFRVAAVSSPSNGNRFRINSKIIILTYLKIVSCKMALSYLIDPD